MISARKTKYDYLGKFNPSKLKANNIDRLSTSFVTNNSKILELGCATGFMSQYFQQQKKCKVFAVDINSQATAFVKKHCKKTITGDLEDKKTWIEIKKYKPYDIVFASSIIEHLSQPEFILQMTKQVLKNSGSLIITIPNIAHWRMRWNLLIGNWNYQDYGVLDKTHLRFFTYYTFQHLIKQAGFKIQLIKIDPAGGIKYFNWIAKYFPNFYAHQILIKAQKA